MTEHTFKHGDVTITLRRSLRLDMLASILDRTLPRYEDVAELGSLRAVYVWLVMTTGAVDGLRWQPPSPQDAADPERAAASFEAWMDAIDSDILRAWEREANQFRQPLTGDEAAPTAGDSDPKN